MKMTDDISQEPPAETEQPGGPGRAWWAWPWAYRESARFISYFTKNSFNIYLPI